MMKMEEVTTSSEEVLKDASMVQVEGAPQQAEPGAQETPPATEAPLEIASLEEAMRFFNKSKQEAAKPEVPEGEAAKKHEEEPATEEPGTKPGEADLGDDGGTVPEVPQGEPQLSTGGAGEPAMEHEVYDPNAAMADVRRELAGITQQAIRKKFADADIKKISIRDLEKVDEKNGTKEFINPDTGRPFSSSNPRSEAQAFVRDYNEELDAQFALECQQLFPQVQQSYAPLIRFQQFLPTWNAMDEVRQEMFEELVKGYELTDKQGNIIAYSCDLNAVNQQMERQIQWLLSKQQPTPAAVEEAPPENQVTQPAVAAKTTKGKTDKADREYDLSNLGDAMAYYNKNKKKKG